MLYASISMFIISYHPICIIIHWFSHDWFVVDEHCDFSSSGKILIIVIPTVGGVLLIMLGCCIYCCCCRRCSRNRAEREETRQRQRRLDREERSSERKRNREDRHNAIRMKYGLLQNVDDDESGSIAWATMLSVSKFCHIPYGVLLEGDIMLDKYFNNQWIWQNVKIVRFDYL